MRTLNPLFTGRSPLRRIQTTPKIIKNAIIKRFLCSQNRRCLEWPSKQSDPFFFFLLISGWCDREDPERQLKKKNNLNGQHVWWDYRRAGNVAWTSHALQRATHAVLEWPPGRPHQSRLERHTVHHINFPTRSFISFEWSKSDRMFTTRPAFLFRFVVMTLRV